jgi:hypothetical protein
MEYRATIKNILYLIFAFFLVLVLFRGTYLLSFFTHNDADPVLSDSAMHGWKEWKSHELGISLMYPPEYNIDSSYVYTPLNPQKGAVGVKFTVPTLAASGTNLSANDTGVSVEVFPDAGSCVAQNFIEEGLETKKLVDGGIDYSVARTTGSTVGNLYEETVYAIEKSSPCTVIRYFIRSAKSGSYDPEAVKEFDRSRLIKEFTAMRQSLVLNR